MPWKKRPDDFGERKFSGGRTCEERFFRSGRVMPESPFGSAVFVPGLFAAVDEACFRGGGGKWSLRGPVRCLDGREKLRPLCFRLFPAVVPDHGRGFFLKSKTPRYAGSSKKAKPLNKLKRGFLCEITSCLGSKSIHKGTQ